MGPRAFISRSILNIDPTSTFFTLISSFSRCRKIALVIILTRAGLDLDPDALKRLRVTVPKLGLIPWVVETLVIAVLTKYLLGLPWIWGFLLGSVIAAVSPAVVVPCLFRLRAKGYGVAKVRISSEIINHFRYCVHKPRRDYFSERVCAFMVLKGSNNMQGGPPNVCTVISSKICIARKNVVYKSYMV